MTEILRRTVRMLVIRTVLLLGVVALTMGFHLISAATPVAVLPDATESLLWQHDCWSGEPPADMQGKVPGHVVARLKDGREVYDAAHVGPALNHLFNGVDNDVATVSGFCR